MATLVLQVAGQALGGSLAGGIGAVVGRAAGGLAGSVLDRTLFGADTVSEGARLSDLGVQTSTEGAAIPRIYGRARIAGQVIWATDFEEVVDEEETGGKGGGATVRTYEYYANFAVALCEGRITRIGRIWADGKPLDQSGVTYRVHHGGEAQAADALIAAKHAGESVPAYRGTAYVVFERLPLADFGNRIPQLTFEVARTFDRLERRIKAVTVIPGTTEFGYSDRLVTRIGTDDETVSDNRHSGAADTDWLAAIDDLVETCPNLESVALVVAWFGTDLRCGYCEIKPGVEARERAIDGATWSVAGVGRGGAHLVSTIDGKPAYGGTPSDETVIAAIADLKRRGLRVVLYPFVMMDVPTGNGLPDPYGAAEQAAYPWRGRITCHPAIGRAATVDKTAAAASQVAAFVGEARAGNLSAGDWRYRHMILHYAELAEAAGGVDAFLIGSEMRGLTTVRSGAARFPFVDALRVLAADASSILRSATKITYAADWSEYFGYHPSDGSGDVYFHLDPLWASAAIDMVGIDNYMPLADWRDGDHADSEVAPSIYDLDYLRGNIAGGEGYDWYYASDADRDTGTRTPITDGAHAKPWVFRYKDLVNWWSRQHFNRPGGVETGPATGWVPESKPIWFTEIGCPAVDRGANQPNVFYDPKSSESFFPYFSSGARDDYMQRRFLDAVMGYWEPEDDAFVASNNPVSSVYAGRMVDPDNIHIWTWDARPYPAFPALGNVWSDGDNWPTGHWLTGRLGGVTLQALVETLLDEYGIADAQVGAIEGAIDGYVLADVVSLRSVLEPLADTFRFTAADSGSRLRFDGRIRAPDGTVGDADIAVSDKDTTRLSVTRGQETELPHEMRIGFYDSGRDYERGTARVRRLRGTSARASGTSLAVAASVSTMESAAFVRLHDIWAARERFTFAVSPERVDIEVGDMLSLQVGDVARIVLVERVEDDGLRKVEARTIDPDAYRLARGGKDRPSTSTVTVLGKPIAAFMDLPMLSPQDRAHAPYLAVYARPWYGTAAVWRSATGESFASFATIGARASLGVLQSKLTPGPEGLWDRRRSLTVRLFSGTLSSRSDLQLLNGANALAVETTNGGWEVLQFANADLVADKTWRLSRLLRAQLGTEDAMAAGSVEGARVVVLNEAVVNLPLARADLGIPRIYRVGPARRNVADAAYAETTLTATGRGLRPFSPVHIRAHRDPVSGDVALTWVRRTRIEGDGWEGREVPLGESRESYEVLILDDGTLLRTLAADEPAVTYTAQRQIADFGALPDALTVSVAQINEFGAGIAREVTLHV